MGGAVYGTITGLVLMWQLSGVFANHRRYQWNTSHPVDSESLATAPKTDVSVCKLAGAVNGYVNFSTSAPVSFSMSVHTASRVSV